MTLRDDLEKVLAMGNNMPTLESVNDFLSAATVLLRDHGPALLEAVRDAERYRWIRLIASGDPADFHFVEDAAFASANGNSQNFDLNIDAAREGDEG